VDVDGEGFIGDVVVLPAAWTWAFRLPEGECDGAMSDPGDGDIPSTAIIRSTSVSSSPSPSVCDADADAEAGELRVSTLFG
jgi:hypothetical protein